MAVAQQMWPQQFLQSHHRGSSTVVGTDPLFLCYPDSRMQKAACIRPSCPGTAIKCHEPMGKCMVVGCLCNPAHSPFFGIKPTYCGPLCSHRDSICHQGKRHKQPWGSQQVPLEIFPFFQTGPCIHCTVSDGALVPTVTARDPRLGQGSLKDGNSRTFCKCCWLQSAQRCIGHCAHRGGGLCSLPFLPVLEGCSNLRSPHAARGREMLRRHFTTPRYPLCSLSPFSLPTSRAAQTQRRKKKIKY